ncbi:MAG: alkylmercury lyase family protein, partial [Chloroflexota bacterium]|nr:alkylmercury lyase family protein [Chloroflexota bacterium]
RVVATEPATAVVVARRDERGPAANTCCPATVFACGEAHGGQLVERLPGTGLLSLPEALAHGEAHFGDLLEAEALPVRRRRWGTIEERREREDAAAAD